MLLVCTDGTLRGGDPFKVQAVKRRRTSQRIKEKHKRRNMKTLQYISNLRMMKKCGGLILCTKCNRAIVYVNSAGYKRLKLDMTCACGSAGEVLLVKSSGIRAERNISYGTAPDILGGAYVCVECNMPMFRLQDGVAEGCSFNAVCVCGKSYRMKSNFSERLGDTLKNINKSCEYVKDIFGEEQNPLIGDFGDAQSYR